jgi:CheY-like chemotaxis protein
VLVVEPDPLRRLALARRLEALGWDTVCLNQGSEALRAVALGLRPDVLLTGGRLPDMAGVALVRALRPRLPGLRAVLLGHEAGAGGTSFDAACDPVLLIEGGAAVVVGRWTGDRLATALALACRTGVVAGQPR